MSKVIDIYVNFTKTTQQIWSCHVTLASNFENVYFLPNSVLNCRKSYQVWAKLAPEQKRYKQKTNWGVETPPSACRVKGLRTSSKNKGARTMKLCTIIAYYITSITKQLKLLNSHCSIVCSYCSVCLMAKNGLKMIEFSSSSWENEIHMVDNLFDEDSNNIIFFQGGPNFAEKTAGKLRENGQ